jgi:hypothetical protein
MCHEGAHGGVVDAVEGGQSLVFHGRGSPCSPAGQLEYRPGEGEGGHAGKGHFEEL